MCIWTVPFPPQCSPHWHGLPGGPPDVAYVTSNMRNITKLLRSYFDESVPIVPALGNHDTSPPDQVQFFLTD